MKDVIGAARFCNFWINILSAKRQIISYNITTVIKMDGWIKPWLDYSIVNC